MIAIVVLIFHLKIMTTSIRLVTGASGYIASHVVKQLLVQGNVRVRGIVRSLEPLISSVAPVPFTFQTTHDED